jgi:hypothetical protein
VHDVRGNEGEADIDLAREQNFGDPGSGLARIFEVSDVGEALAIQEFFRDVLRC